MVLTEEQLSFARHVVSEHVPVTPVRRWPLLEQATGMQTWVKHENHNPTGAFKVRGGLTYMARLTASGRVRGVVSASRGNHSQSLAFAGRAAGVPVTIVVPEGNSPDKNAATAAFGATVVVHGADFQEALEHSRQLAGEKDLIAIPPLHPWLVEGVATCAYELHQALPDLDVIYVPVGMGSNICANLAVRELLGKRTQIVGVVSDRAPAYALSFDAGAVVSTQTADTFVDGVACRTPDPLAVSTINRGAERIVRVTEDQAAAAMTLMYRATHQLAEPAGALGLAAILADKARLEDKRVAFIQTGGNCDFDVLQRAFAAA